MYHDLINSGHCFGRVRRQHLWDQIGDLRYGGFLAHRNPKESEDEPEILRPTRPCASRKAGPRYSPRRAQAPFRRGQDPHRPRRAARRGKHRGPVQVQQVVKTIDATLLTREQRQALQEAVLAAQKLAAE